LCQEGRGWQQEGHEKTTKKNDKKQWPLGAFSENTANVVTAFFPSSSDTSSLRAASRGCKLLFERNCPVSDRIVYYESSEGWSQFATEGQPEFTLAVLGLGPRSSSP